MDCLGRYEHFPDPVTLSIAAIGATAGSQIYGGMVASAEAKSQQNIARYNAQVAEQEAKAMEQRTALEQRRQAEEAERRQSTMLAQMGQAGAVTTAGTPLLVQVRQAAEDELKNLMIGYEGATQASRQRSQAALERTQAGIYGSRAKSAMWGAGIGAGTTLLTGYASGVEKGYWGSKKLTPENKATLLKY